MREIKFRYIFRDHIGKFHVLPQHIATIGERNDILYNIRHGWELVARSEFTGLKDKNGKEIYEGDIVKIHRGYAIPSGVVYWNEDSAGFGVKHHYYDNYVDLDTVETVIGNIWENPELLEGK